MTEGKNNRSVKENILLYLKEQGVTKNVTSIRLLTNVSTLGYSFNPISFYLCFDENELRGLLGGRSLQYPWRNEIVLVGADTLKEERFENRFQNIFTSRHSPTWILLLILFSPFHPTTCTCVWMTIKMENAFC